MRSDEKGRRKNSITLDQVEPFYTFPKTSPVNINSPKDNISDFNSSNRESQPRSGRVDGIGQDDDITERRPRRRRGDHGKLQ